MQHKGHNEKDNNPQDNTQKTSIKQHGLEESKY